MKRYIGIMSGTSLDGVDVALCQIDKHCCLLEESYYIPFDNDLKNQIINMINGTTTFQEVGKVDYLLGTFFAKAVNELLEKAELSSEDIVAIGSHGQTVWHQPNDVTPFSMQLGNPSVLAVHTKIDVVTDFRSKDIALGGQGAPFAPAFHHFLFSHIQNCAVLNIGGMANISIFEPNLIGYDTGCGNVLMDLWIKECKNEEYDKDGAWAKSGTVNPKLLNNMLEDKYFLLNFPKSTGREYFNKEFLIKYLKSVGKIPNEDIQATLLALTVTSIANEIKKFKIEKLLVCGGGTKNIFLMEQLQELLPHVEVSSTTKYGVDSDNLEAMIFAWFAHKRLANEKINLKSVTGAKKNIILGAIYAKD